MWICLLIAAATVAVYWQVAGFEFVSLDDDRYVWDNPMVTGGLNWQGIRWAFTTNWQANWHPLTWLSLQLDASVGGAKPGVFHITNLALHVCNALLLFALLNSMTGKPWRSGFAAALFALHPLHVESVAWVTERKDVLSTLFWMLTMLAYVGYARSGNKKLYALTMMVFALGLMCKPMLVTLPVVLLMMDYWPLKREQGTRDRRKKGYFNRLLIEKLPMLALSAAACAATLWAQSAGGAVQDFQTHPLGVRVANALVACVTYIRQMIWPANLAAFYPHPGDSLPTWQVVGSGVLLAAVTAAAVRFRRSAPWFCVGWAWYLVTLVPVIGLVQVGGQAMADRYTYVPLVGLFVGAAWALPNLLARTPRPLAAAGVIVLAALAVVAYNQAGCWRNSKALFTHAIEVTAPNPNTYTNVGIVLAGEGDVPGAIELFREAVDMAPDNAFARNNLGFALVQQGNPTQAREHLSAAVELSPREALFHNNLGMAYAELRLLPEALRHFKEAVRLKPWDGRFKSNLEKCIEMLERPSPGISTAAPGKQRNNHEQTQRDPVR